MSNETLFFLSAFADLFFVFFAARRGIEWLYGSIIANLILIGIFGAKLVAAFGIVTNVGNVFYACVFMATYFLIEKHGKRAALKTIWFGLFCVLFFSILSQLAARSSGLEESAGINETISKLFSFSPRVFIGSMAAYMFAQYINISIYSWLGELTKGKFLWLRSNGANIISQLVDSTLFFSIVFFDLPGPLLVQAILVGWGVKTAVLFLGTPFLYLDARINRGGDMRFFSSKNRRIVHSAKGILKSLYITFGVFLFLFLASNIGGAFYASTLAEKSAKAFNAGIAAELAHLKKEGDEIAQNELLQKYLLANDAEHLLALLQKEKAARSVGLMGVANSEGIIVSRTMSRSNLGQNVFVTVPAGRVVAQGKSAQSVEMTGFGNQLFITTARPIMRSGKMIGALFANALANDEYAAGFRDKYLSNGSEVVFYTKEFGVYGDSFSDPESRKLLNSYFNSGSEWISDGKSDKTVFFKHGTYYLVKNIIFPGLEKSPGGALLFVPRKDISGLANIIIALTTCFVFIFFASRYHVRSRGEERGLRYYVLLLLSCFLVGGFAFFIFFLKNSGFIQLQKVPYILYNSTLRFQPEFGIYDINFEQRIAIFADTGDEPINAAQIGVAFDPAVVEVRGFETKNTACSYEVENVISPREGKANLACALFKAGGERGSVKIADVVIKPKLQGTFTLNFDKTYTKVLASDGLGTNVLRMSQSGSYQVDSFDPALFTTTTKLKSFIVFSPTHPNYARWYNEDKIRFAWYGKKGSVYKYVFDTSPDTAPSVKNATQDSQVEISAPGDGIFFFHLQLASGGPVAHYRVQIDRTPPLITSIKMSEEEVFAGDVVRFSFEAEDKGSGIQQNYYINLGNHLFLPIGSQLFVPFLETGNHEVVLRVYDDAGNYSEKTSTVFVKNPGK